MRVSWDFLFGNLFRSCPSPFGRGRREAPGEGRKCTLIRPFGPPSPRGRRTRASISANLDTTALGGGLCCDSSTIREKSRRRTGLRLQRFRYASILYFLKVPAQPVQDFLTPGIAEFPPEFFQSEVDHVVMMDLLRGNLATQFEPDSVQEINLLGSESRRMRAQVENVFLTAWEMDLQSQFWGSVDAPRQDLRYEPLQQRIW